MKSFVITIMDHPKSVEMAERCIKTFKRHQGDDSIEMFDAITPDHNVFSLAEYYKIPMAGFHEVYSRYDRCLSAFMSHYMLWRKCVELDEPIVIFEHDAFITNKIPNMTFTGCISIGKPSYGKWNPPLTLGVNRLTSKKYFPGAHAYILSPDGAKALIKQAKRSAGPTDTYLNLKTFPWLQEYYPWPVEARDTFTTIQNENGCYAKHNFGLKYEII